MAFSAECTFGIELTDAAPIRSLVLPADTRLMLTNAALSPKTTFNGRISLVAKGFKTKGTPLTLATFCRSERAVCWPLNVHFRHAVQFSLVLTRSSTGQAVPPRKKSGKKRLREDVPTAADHHEEDNGIVVVHLLGAYDCGQLQSVELEVLQAEANQRARLEEKSDNGSDVTAISSSGEEDEEDDFDDYDDGEFGDNDEHEEDGSLGSDDVMIAHEGRGGDEWPEYDPAAYA